MKKIVYIFGLITFILISLYLSFTIVNNAYIGIKVKYTQEGKWEVSKIQEHSWAENNNILIGQEIITINHEPPWEWLSVKLYSAIGKANHLQFIDNGEIKDVQINRNYNNDILYFHLIIPLLFIIIAFIFSWHLYRNVKQRKLNNILFIFINLFGIGYLSAGAAVRMDIFAQFFVFISLLVIPTLFLHFLYSFFSEKYEIKPINNRVVYSFYILCTVIILLKALLVSMALGQYFTLFNQLALISFVSIIIVIIYTIIKCYMKTRKSVIAPIIKIIIVAILLSFGPFVVGNIIPSLFFSRPFISGEGATVFLFLLPMTLFYLIMTNKLIDIDFVIKRLYYYFSLAILFLIASKLILFYFYDLTLFEHVQFFIIFFPIIVLFLYFKDRLEHKFQYRLFPEKNNLHIRAQNFVRFMSKVMKRSEFDTRLIEEIKSVLSVSEVSVLEFSKNEVNKTIREDNLKHEISLQLQSNIYSVAELYQVKSGYYIVIGETSETTYVLAIGNKKNNIKLNEDEEEWLTTIAYLTYIAYENLHHIDELFQKIKVLENKDNKYPWLSRLIFNLQETERRKLANDLHDTILQEQVVLHQKIGMILTTHNLSDEVKEQLIEVKNGFMDAIYDIRETCYELRPPFLLEIGLVKALDNYIRKVQLRNNFIVEFDYERLDVQLDDECTSHMYRIVQELLNNASKHSEASRVNLILSSQDDIVSLKYEDNGKGITDPVPDSSAESIGLSGIKERVSSLEGKVEINSTHNNGLEMMISIPVNRKIGVV